MGHTDVKYAGLEGDFGDCVTHLCNKAWKLTRADTTIVKDDLIVINSFDEAVHGETEKKACSITSYNSAVVTKEMLRSGVSSTSTKSILMWKQVIGEESMSNVVPVVKELYRWIGEHTTDGVTTMDGIKNGKRIYVYEVHDGKMIYNLTEHSKWNCKYHPFLLCGCLRGDGVVNPDQNIYA